MTNITKASSIIAIALGSASVANAQLVLSDLLAGQNIVDEWHSTGEFSGDLTSAMEWFDLSYANLSGFVNTDLGSGTPVLPDPSDPGGSAANVFLGSEASVIIPPGASTSFIVAARTDFAFDFDLDDFTDRTGEAVFGLGTSPSWDDLVYAVSYNTMLETNASGSIDGKWSADIFRFGDPMTAVPEPSTYGLIGALALVGLIAQRRYSSKSTAVVTR